MDEASRGAGLCHAGHALVEFATDTGDYGCDVCDALQRRGVRMFGCRACDWDVCEGCERRRASGGSNEMLRVLERELEQGNISSSEFDKLRGQLATAGDARPSPDHASTAAPDCGAPAAADRVSLVATASLTGRNARFEGRSMLGTRAVQWVKRASKAVAAEFAEADLPMPKNGATIGPRMSKHLDQLWRES
jgi:hypothetical protein